MNNLRTKTTKLYDSCCDLIKQVHELSEENLVEAREHYAFTMSLAEAILEDALAALKKENTTPKSPDHVSN